MTINVRAIVIVVAMLIASGLAGAMRPTKRLADSGPAVDLSKIVPTQFADWSEETTRTSQVVNPQQQEKLNQLYAQILSRTYVNASGYRIMLSIAYGGNQTDQMQVHRPEICYPAQGFQLWKNIDAELVTNYGTIPVKHLLTKQNRRIEPVTYWTTIGLHAVQGGIQKKLIEMRYGLSGEIPDGLLFRVSSIDENESNAFNEQERFVKALLDAATPEARTRLSGLGAKSKVGLGAKSLSHPSVPAL